MQHKCLDVVFVYITVTLLVNNETTVRHEQRYAKEYLMKEKKCKSIYLPMFYGKCFS